MKKFLHRIPGFKKLDDFTDTPLGMVCVAWLVVIAVSMWLYWRTHK